MMKIHNVAEDFVYDMMELILKTKTDICKCDKCKADIAALSLNNLKPMYVTSEMGNVISRTEIMDSELRTSLLVNVTEAIEKVSANPHHRNERE
ncbi:MAG: late competence development ComFB family protein [Syntrophomonadaceae bacterium]|jgi:competence protein ComFB|nr:late competence development ComFB family protein [Syntrophomonadaceae bacterium]